MSPHDVTHVKRPERHQFLSHLHTITAVPVSDLTFRLGSWGRIRARSRALQPFTKDRQEGESGGNTSLQICGALPLAVRKTQLAAAFAVRPPHRLMCKFSVCWACSVFNYPSAPFRKTERERPGLSKDITVTIWTTVAERGGGKVGQISQAVGARSVALPTIQYDACRCGARFVFARVCRPRLFQVIYSIWS